MLDTARTINVTDPTGADMLGSVGLTEPGDIAAIVSAAGREQRAWAERAVFERAEILLEAAARLEPQIDELGDLLASESGKPIDQARFEVRGAVSLLRANAQFGRAWSGVTLPTEGLAGTERDLAFTRREPLGVVAAILPFNFPVELLVEKSAAALIGGNAVAIKAPPEDPLTVTRVHAELISAGVPEALAPLLNGDAEVGATLASADGVDAVSLTGSTAAGIAVAHSAAGSLRRLHLELGGNNAALVLADADLDLVTSELGYGRLLMNGQACSASKRIVVHRSRHDELVDRLAEVVRRQRVGPALDAATTIGPLITPSAAARVESQVNRAIAAGATLAAGTGRADGAFFSPCLLGSIPTDADLAVDDEIFGPVFALIAVNDPHEALTVANRSSFGLMASVFSGDLQLAMAMAERIEAGGVVINGTDNYRPPVIPFGGVKLSGSGREGAGYTIGELTREKTIVLRRFRTTLEGP
jgi:acyl-CoA reductase-like NAD-dependent aldehyde dehydrogenase